MAIKFQYNKTSLQQLNKQLNVRLRALPTLKNKEAALRMEVKKAKDKIHDLDKKLSSAIAKDSESVGLWNEFQPDLIGVADVKISTKKIAGVKIPVFEKIAFSESEFSIFENPKWFSNGISIVKNLAEIYRTRIFYSQNGPARLRTQKNHTKSKPVRKGSNSGI